MLLNNQQVSLAPPARLDASRPLLATLSSYSLRFEFNG
jgi:hypothetical protein